MKIGIYARGLAVKFGGAKQYIESMTRAIIDNLSAKDELYIFHNFDSEYFGSNKKNVKEIFLKSKNKLLCDFVLCPYYVNKLKIDVMWFPKNVVPFFIKSKVVISILDLLYFMPQYNECLLSDTLYMKLMIPISCRRADRIIAISENTKKDIVNIIGIDENKIDVVYLAPDKKYKLIGDQKKLDRIRRKYKLDNKFILFTGAISPRKNLIRLIESFNKISDKIPHELIITGGKSWKTNDVNSLIKNSKKVRKIGFVSDEDMPILYNLADLYIYPSLYEGFGLPILEAQSCGCPVITSDTSSIPEVVGDAGIKVNPYDVNALKTSIETIFKNHNLRKKMIKSGLERAKCFTWEKIADDILNIFRKVS